MMYTYESSIRVKVNVRSQVVKTEISALDARWLLWAQFGLPLGTG